MNESVWTGRVDEPITQDNLRYHQIVKIQQEITEVEPSQQVVALIGFECDEGVRLNNGKQGSKYAPDLIRQSLGNIPWRADQAEAKLYDFGNITRQEESLEEIQQQLGSKVMQLCQTYEKVVILGGGHEALLGHYLGVRNAIGSDKIIGLINIDTHFDLHEYSNEANSGTMFKQILDKDEHALYLACGVGRYSNTSELFKRADAYGVQYICEDELSRAELQMTIDEFAQKCDTLIVTLCMDVLNVAYAPGVNTASPYGLEPKQVREILQLTMRQPAAKTFSICEVNPQLDSNHRTEKLAAQLTNEVIMTLLNG